MPILRLENLCKRYASNDVIHSINLEMRDREFTVLVGPSGCGKSTTLRMIAGLESVSDGEIYIDDRPVSSLEPKARDLAMVFQDYALYPHMNVAKNMSFALKLQKRPKKEIDQKVNEVAEMLGLTNFLHRKPAELSGGQRQRVAMGRALTRDAATFLFDEPLSNLDAKLRGQMRAELALMSQRVQKNMVYVTHDQVEAMTLADRIVVMQDGHIRQQGTPEELFKKPNSKFVAGFIGSPPMNFLEGTLEHRGDMTCVVGQGYILSLLPEQAQRVNAANQKDIILGIRPSDLSYAPDAKDGDALELTVLISEYIGAQSILLASCGDQKISVEMKSDNPIELQKNMKFQAVKQGIHLFDRKTEVAL